MSLVLKQINENAKEVGKPLVYVYFKTKSGKRGNIIYQKGRYFSLIENNKLLLLNPLREVEPWMQKIHSKEWKLIATGSLESEIPITSRNLVILSELNKEKK